MTKNPFVPEFGVPLKVEPMRVRRTYSGGTGIDRWHNEAGRFGLERPEEWLASVTPAINPGFAKEEGEGLSRVEWQGSVFPQIFPFGLRKNGMLVHPSNLRGAGAETVSAYGVPPRCYPRTLAALLRNPGYPGHDRLYAQSHP